MPQKQNDEKPTAFKHWINEELIQKMAKSLERSHPEFSRKEFLKISKSLGPLELKQRVQLVRDGLYQHLPQDYLKALPILLKSLEQNQLSGFDLWPYTEFVQKYGLLHPKQSLNALATLTQRFTSEFAVRPFLKQHKEFTLDFLIKCTKHSNKHLRRWASEGSRPRLPWGERLDEFVKDPRPTLKILESLLYDEELYVRKSVANHLNDISKDNPELLLKTLRQWDKKCPKSHRERWDWILRHSLRSLIKAGHPEALALVGVQKNTQVEVKNFVLHTPQVKMNQKLSFEFTIASKSTKPQKLVVDYLLHLKKSNGSTNPKVFKLKTFELPAKAQRKIEKNHAIKEITTRKYYGGEQYLELQINGKSYGKKLWNLKLPKA